GPQTVNIVDPTNPNTQVLGIPGPGMYEFQWTVSNGDCDDAVDNVIITIDPIPAQAQILGGNRTICGEDSPTTVINASAINAGDVGTWTFVDGPVILTFTPDDEISTVVSG